MATLADRAVRVALLVVESAWIFLVLSVIGAGVGDGGPLLSWPGVLILLGIGLVVQRWTVGLHLPEAWTRSVALWTSVVVVYVLVAVHEGGGLWLLRMVRGDLTSVDLSRTLLVLGATLLLWWRGLWMGARTAPGETLGRVFPWGMGVLIGAALFQVVTGESMPVTPLAFLFFAASLGGLALSNLEEGALAPPWARLFAVVTGVVLVAGFIVSLLPETFLSNVALGLLGAAGLVAEGFLVVVLFFVEYLLRGLIAAMEALLGLVGQENLAPRTGEAGGFAGLREAAQQGDGIPGTIIAILKWSFITVAVLAVLGFLYWVLWTRLMGRGDGEGMVRESVRDEASPEDMGSLLAGLMPRWRSAPPPYRYALPRGRDPDARVRRAYYRLLNAATRRGRGRGLAETPLEYASRLKASFPQVPVEGLTDAFDRVRFGMIHVAEDEAGGLERAVEQVTGVDREVATPEDEAGA